jgi:hypothetical protein
LNIKAEVLETRDRLKSLKTEFAQVEIKFDDFNFNDEMIEVLMNSPVQTNKIKIFLTLKCKCIQIIYYFDDLKRQDIAPFANLFIKHVGNLNERYKLSEATYDRFLDKFIELKHRLKRPTTIRSENQTNEHLSVKIADLFTRQEQLLARLNETKAELSKQHTKTSECKMTKSWDELEPQGDHLAETDTVKLAVKVNDLRIRLGISMQSLAEQLNLSRSYLSSLLHSPKPWSSKEDSIWRD